MRPSGPALIAVGMLFVAVQPGCQSDDHAHHDIVIMGPDDGDVFATEHDFVLYEQDAGD